MGMARYPQISVVLPTRNRPTDAQRCLASLTTVRYPAWELLLVDQSDDDHTRLVAEAFARALPNLIYQRMNERGCSLAYNTGLGMAAGELIAFLNDDCTVSADWLEAVAGVFSRYPRAGIVFGSVASGPHNPAESFIPTYDAGIERQIRGRLGCLRLGGMGASMYIRRAVAQQVGPFDTYLGPGAYFSGGADDVDYRYRCLAHGHVAVATPAIAVVHHGARDYASGAAADLLRGYAYSAGALVMKLLRCGELAALLLTIRGWPYLASRDIRARMRFHGVRRLDLIEMFLRGMRDSFQCAVDRRSCLYEAFEKERAHASVERET